MGTKTDEHFMRLAIAKALEGIAKGQSPFGACIVRDGAAISCEHNAVWQSTDITAHAEVRAIRAACAALATIDLSGCVIYATCEPCPMCFGACHWAKLARIAYGARIEDARQLGFSELTIPNEKMRRLGHSPIAVAGGVLREENLALFRAWAKRKDRRTY